MNQHQTVAATEAGTSDTLWARRAAAVALFAALTAIGARLAVPLPGTPIPFTLQPVAVLLTGVLLGSRLGAASQFAYLAAGAAGLPVFAAGGGLAYLGGPTGGYLLAFPVAAFVAGWIAGAKPNLPRVIAGSVVGLLIVHLSGAAWLSLQPIVTGGSAQVFRLSFEPFFVGDLLKVALVAVVALGLGDRVRRFVA
ncbi:MAG: biotin transporter BioY [Gemmatimonadota bacterium]